MKRHLPVLQAANDAGPSPYYAPPEGYHDARGNPRRDDEARRKSRANDRLRSARPFVVRAVTIDPQRIGKNKQWLARFDYRTDVQALGGIHPRRPATRGECEDHKGPCPFVSCRWHMAYDVDPYNGALKENFPGLELEDMPATCALDVADKGGSTLEDVGRAMNLTRERVRQLEMGAARKVYAAIVRGRITVERLLCATCARARHTRQAA